MADAAPAEPATASANPPGDAPAAAAPAVLVPPVDAAVANSVPDAGAAPTAAAPVEPAPAKPETSAPSLLEAASGKPPAKEAAKPADGAAAQPAPAEAAPAPAAEAAKASDPVTEAPAAPQPPAPVKYEAFKVPDGIALDDKELARFTEVAGAAQIKQEDAQKLVDLYLAERQRDAEAMQTEQRKFWDNLNDTWKSELRKDETLGGNRLETSLSMAKAVIEEYGGSPEQVRDLLAHTSNNGMGNYPGFVRLLHNIGQALNIFEDSVVPANPSPPKAAKSPGNRGWYDGSMGNGQAAP